MNKNRAQWEPFRSDTFLSPAVTKSLKVRFPKQDTIDLRIDSPMSEFVLGLRASGISGADALWRALVEYGHLRIYILKD